MEREERFIGVDEACEYLGIKKATLYSWKNRGMVPCYKPTGKKGVLAFKKTELKEFMEKGRIDYEHTV